MDDHALLREYLEQHSEKAFSELVDRYLPLVYGTALRLSGDTHAAQDVAQAVFIQLARKAWTIRNGHALPGWLYRATHHAAYAAHRTEFRRRERETAAMNLAEQNQPANTIAEQIAPLLDDALAGLSRVEQDALLLRFFQDKNFREVGATLGLNEEAARKRTDRALDKIRLHFSRRGITATAALLGSALTTHAATPPPAGFATKVVTSSFAQVSGVAGFIQAVWATYFMTTTSKVITTAVLVALITSISLYVHYNTTASLNEPLDKSANNTPVSVGPGNPALAAVSAPNNQVAAPKLLPVPASNMPSADPQGLLLIAQAQKKTITNNLRTLATAGQQYMRSKKVSHVAYSDIVGMNQDSYILPDQIPLVGNESYENFTIDESTTQVTQVAPDGSIVTYNL